MPRSDTVRRRRVGLGRGLPAAYGRGVHPGEYHYPPPMGEEYTQVYPSWAYAQSNWPSLRHAQTPCKPHWRTPHQKRTFAQAYAHPPCVGQQYTQVDANPATHGRTPKTSLPHYLPPIHLRSLPNPPRWVYAKISNTRKDPIPL